MANTDQGSAPLIENNRQTEDHLEIDILEPAAECCVYKVPERFREVKETVYTPRLISIGPVHHGNKNLVKMERQKLTYYKKFLERTSKGEEEFLSFVEENVNRIKRCYDKFVFETEFDASKFVTMILYDAVFIIEFMKRSSDPNFLLNREWLSLELRSDLILLENQLPFFVLEGLYKLAFGETSPFLPLACDYLRIGADSYYENEEIKHLLDLARCSAVRSRPPNSGEIVDQGYNAVDQVYNATMLHEAGIDFEAVEYTLLDVRFDMGKLQIPIFHLTHRIEAFIRNLMALEQCHYYPERAYFCSYIQLLDWLVDTDKDVDLLVKKGIFVNGMGSSAAVADMINTLMVGVVRRKLPHCYDKIGKDLNQYHDNFGNRTKASLRHVYFNNLWRGTATVAAFFVVLFTLTQTILAILDRAMPTK